MKIFRLIGMLLLGSSTLFSCSNNEDELPPKEQEQTNQETYTISFNLGGEFISTSETPLSRTEVTPKKIYGINVYYKKDGDTWYQNYAYGLFDNIQDMTISLISGYKYKFECTMVQNDADTLYHEDNTYYAPFHQATLSYDIYKGTVLENKFNVSTTSYIQIQGLKSGKTSLKGKRGYNDIATSPQTDRFYGELTDYVPTKDGVANINLKRTAFGLKFIVTPPTDGTLFVNPERSHDNVYNGPEIKVSADESTLTFSSMYTFFQVYECWQMENYTDDLTITLTWERANGATQTFMRTITVKRNVLTTVNVNVNGSSTDSSLGVKEDDTPIGNENVDMNFNGGDLDDNEVNPNV
ncbi:hypothetical protein [Bacteroides nordii]|jgi:hypothetical protein|uniref:hypothetical protein n=3 Tax=Bacteroides TaxID=816 RepID=UPI001E2F4935|nr:hypothetical protein [Bacteroides nordii]UYU48287.1 hypothetical protein KQP55_16620 [Bacteroides nordii]